MASGAYARSTVDIEADVVVASQPALSSVQPDAHSKGLAFRPVLLSEAPLNRHSCGNSVRRRLKDGEEGIAFRAYLDPIVFGERLPHDRGVPLQNVAIVLA